MNFLAKALVLIHAFPLRKISRTSRLKLLTHPVHQRIHCNPAVDMSAPVSRALRRCVCTAKPNSSYLRPTAAFAQQRIAQRWQSTDAAAPTNPKIATIVDQISQLTLLETADLVSTLKVWHARSWEARREGGESRQEEVQRSNGSCA